MAGSLFCGRSPAHEAETVREQHPTYNYSTRSGPQRGASQLILIGRSSEFEGKYRTRMGPSESEQNCSLQSAALN
jgi:hypothetical protein